MIIKNFKLEIHGEIKKNYLYVYLYYVEGNSKPVQYSCLENSMYGGTWWATVPGVAELDTTE